MTFTSPTGNPTFFRTYSRHTDDGREGYLEVCQRSTKGLAKTGKFTGEEFELVSKMMEDLKVLPSGRWLWVGGTDWLEQQQNFSSAFNCTTTTIDCVEAFGYMMDLGMMGCGTGATIEDKHISKLPPVKNHLEVRVVGKPGEHPVRLEETTVEAYDLDDSLEFEIVVGDSRQGWVASMQTLLELAFKELPPKTIKVTVDISSVRPDGTPIKGFGGVANPIKLSGMYGRLVSVLNQYVGRQLDAKGVCLLLDEVAVTIVAGNVRRYAGMRQLNSNAPLLKDNLWVQDKDGNWKIDPERDALRMSNHTRVFHYKPSLDECVQSVFSQYHSGEGAIQWAGEAVARANADILNTEKLKREFLSTYGNELTKTLGIAPDTFSKKYLSAVANNSIGKEELEHRMGRIELNPCFRGDMRLLTADGYKTFSELDGTEPIIINRSGQYSQSKVWCSGEKQTVKLTLTTREYIYCTPDHILMTTEGQMPAADCKGKQLSVFLKRPDHSIKYRLLGFVQGDGQLSGKALVQSHGVVVNVGKDDGDILSLIEHGGLSYNRHDERHIYLYGLNDDLEWLEFSREQLPHRILPTTYSEWSRTDKAAFLNGIYSANGSVISGGRIAYKTACKELVFQLMETLRADFGIESYFTTNKSKMVEFENGTYQCRESYDLNIQKYEHRCVFFNQIGFSLDYKTEKLANYLLNAAPVVRSVKEDKVALVYDFSEPLENWGVVEGILAHNCGEIIGKNLSCNLSEIHLNQIDPLNLEEQKSAFTAGALSVAALLQRPFHIERYQQSREFDPIVGVSFTGLFDFFVNAFGAGWLRWWEAGRKTHWDSLRFEELVQLNKIATLLNVDDNDDVWMDSDAALLLELEKRYLQLWKETAFKAVWDYCDKHNLKRPNRCTTVQPAGCLDKDAVRIFDQGLLFADEIMSPGGGEYTDINLSVRSGMKVDTGIANEPLKLVKVTLQNGRTLRMTPNHRLSSEGEWVFASELMPGMTLDFSLGEYNSSHESKLMPAIAPAHATSKTGRPHVQITTPSAISPDFGYFLGMMFGDGCMSPNKYRVRFAGNNKQVFAKLQQIALELFGISGTVKEEDQRKCGELCFANRILYEWLEANELHKYAKSKDLDRIPVKLRQSSTDTLLAFFAGLIDSDGCLSKNGTARICGASEKFLRHLQQVGEAVGLCFALNHETKGKNLQLGGRSIWVLNLSRMTSKPEAIKALNQHSIKAQTHPILAPKRQFKFTPYKITHVEFETTPDYSYDVAVEGIDDNDSWYWQGAIKSHNTKSLLTGASSGWHPPKAQRYVRRITFTAHDPVAMACVDYGYTIVPSQSCKDENGNLLNDPFDPRVGEWLVEIPVEVPWANMEGADQIDISQFSAAAQFDFYMQCQKYYASHNVSGTIELREHEIQELGSLIHNAIENDLGYISCALLARFDAKETYPRLPFEPISKETYDDLQRQVLNRRETEDFQLLLERYDAGWNVDQGVTGCDSDKCLMK